MKQLSQFGDTRREEEKSHAGGTTFQQTVADDHRGIDIAEFLFRKCQNPASRSDLRGHGHHHRPHRRYPFTRDELDQEIRSCGQHGSRLLEGACYHHTQSVSRSHRSRPNARTRKSDIYQVDEDHDVRKEWSQFSSHNKYDIVLPGFYNDSHATKAYDKSPSSYHPPPPWYHQQKDRGYNDGLFHSNPERYLSRAPATVREHEMTMFGIHRISSSATTQPDDQRHQQSQQPQHHTTTTTTMHTITTSTTRESTQEHQHPEFVSCLQRRPMRRPDYEREDSSSVGVLWRDGGSNQVDQEEPSSARRPKSTCRRAAYGREDSSVGVFQVDDSRGVVLLSYNEEEQEDKPRDPQIPFLENDMWATNTSEHGLALAHVIDMLEDGDVPYLVAAIEYDPDAKPAPRLERGGVRLGVTLFLLLLFTSCLVTMMFVFGMPARQGMPYRETLGILEELERWLPHGRFRDPNDPYGRAYRWITHEDPLQIQPMSPIFHQRFALALLYFLTSQDGDWTDDCAPLQSPGNYNSRMCFMNHKTFGHAVEKLEGATGRHWMSGTSECDWGGIGCDGQGTVYRISLVAAGLSGKLPEELSLLPSLKYLSLGGNKLTGIVSNDFVRSQKHLIVFSSWENSLSGTLPRDLFINCKTVEVQDNRLYGNLSLRAPNLKHFEASHNHFTGTLPQGFGNGKSLAELHIDDNFLSSTIPESFGGPWLFILSLRNNRLQGRIPETLGARSKALKVLNLGSNEITGTIPPALGCPSCVEINLSNNLLTGTLDETVVTAKKLPESLARLAIAGNQLSGTIPLALATFPELSSLRVESNNFLGSIPEAFCSVERATAGFDEIAVSADCRSEDGIIEVNCSCCTTCCDSNGRNCVGQM